MSGVHPPGWQLADLAQTTTSLGGGTPSKAVTGYWHGGSIPWVTPKDMKTFLISGSEDRVTEAALERLSIIPPKSVLLVVRSGILSRTVPVAVTDVPVTINQDMRAFIPEAGVNARFLAWQIIAKEQDVLRSCSKHGTTVASLEGPALARFSLWLAPVLEQTRIVEKLEELLSDIDAGVAELKAAHRKLTQSRQSLLKAAVEGMLTSDWRTKQPPGESGAQLLERVLTERRAHWEAKQVAKFKEHGKAPPRDWQKQYAEPMKPIASGTQVLPNGWVWASIDQLSVEQRYGSSSKTSDDSTGVPVLRMGNIQDGELDLSGLKYLPEDHDEFPQLHLEDGDLLFNRTNSPELVGKTAVYRSQISPCSFASYLISVRFSSGYIPELASVFINSGYGRRWIKSVAVQQVGQANVNGSKLAALAVPVPPLKEQAEIVAVLHAQLSGIRTQLEGIETSLKHVFAQRQNILRAAFAGRLVPQDPNDEPASALLERIRASRVERAMQPKARKSRQQKEMAAVVRKLIEVLAEAGDWMPAQEAFRRCGVADGAETDAVEALYAELRGLDKSGRLAVEAVTDANGRKLHDRLKLLAD